MDGSEASAVLELLAVELKLNDPRAVSLSRVLVEEALDLPDQLLVGNRSVLAPVPTHHLQQRHQRRPVSSHPGHQLDR
jgi:hypothetical protein